MDSLRVWSGGVAVLGGFLASLFLAGPACRRADDASRVRVPEETSIVIALQEPLRSGIAQGGEPVLARMVESVRIDGRTAIPQGAVVHGSVIEVGAVGLPDPSTAITIRFDGVETAGGSRLALQTYPIRLVAVSDPVAAQRGRNVLAAGIAGRGSDSGLGTGPGSVLGEGADGERSAVVLATGDRGIDLPRGQRFVVRLRRGAEMRVTG